MKSERMKSAEATAAVRKETAISKAKGLVKERQTTPPEGYFSAEEFAASQGVGDSTARRQLARLVEDGSMVMVYIAVGLTGGRRKFFGFKEDEKDGKEKDGNLRG